MIAGHTKRKENQSYRNLILTTHVARVGLTLWGRCMDRGKLSLINVSTLENFPSSMYQRSKTFPHPRIGGGKFSLTDVSTLENFPSPTNRRWKTFPHLEALFC